MQSIKNHRDNYDQFIEKRTYSQTMEKEKEIKKRKARNGRDGGRNRKRT